MSDLAILLVIGEFVLSWWLIGLIAAILLQVPNWWTGSHDIELDRELMVLSCAGPIFALVVLGIWLMSWLSNLYDHSPRLRRMLTLRFPAKLVILKARRREAAPTQST